MNQDLITEDVFYAALVRPIAFVELVAQFCKLTPEDRVIWLASCTKDELIALGALFVGLMKNDGMKFGLTIAIIGREPEDVTGADVNAMYQALRQHYIDIGLITLPITKL